MGSRFDRYRPTLTPTVALNRSKVDALAIVLRIDRRRDHSSLANCRNSPVLRGDRGRVREVRGEMQKSIRGVHL